MTFPSGALGLALDHLVVAAPTLDAGATWVADRLGVLPTGGGAHPGMATHNRLVGMGDCYLEVLARDPSGKAVRSRWFGLDAPAWSPDTSTEPRLIAYVLRTSDLDGALARFDLRAIAAEASRGALRWRIGLRADGTMPFDGAGPTFIEWPDGIGPAATLPDNGCRLRSLAVVHPQADAIARALRPNLAGERITFAVGSLSLCAAVETPRGSVLIGGGSAAASRSF